MSEDKNIVAMKTFCETNYPDLKCHIVDDGEVIYALLSHPGFPGKSKMVYWNCWYGDYEVYNMDYERKECGPV